MPVLAHCRLPAWRLPAACRQYHRHCAPPQHAERTINKVPIAQGLDARTYDYLLSHTREPKVRHAIAACNRAAIRPRIRQATDSTMTSGMGRRACQKATSARTDFARPCTPIMRCCLQVLQALREETAALRGARMQITPEQGQFMAQLAQLLGARKYLELGVFTGYSALAVALALPADGAVVALERDPQPLEMARKFWAEAGVASKVDCRVGPAAETLVGVERDHGRTFDMAFVGAFAAARAVWHSCIIHVLAVCATCRTPCAAVGLTLRLCRVHDFTRALCSACTDTVPSCGFLARFKK